MIFLALSACITIADYSFYLNTCFMMSLCPGYFFKSFSVSCVDLRLPSSSRFPWPGYFSFYLIFLLPGQFYLGLLLQLFLVPERLPSLSPAQNSLLIFNLHIHWLVRNKSIGFPNSTTPNLNSSCFSPQQLPFLGFIT